MSEFLKLLQDCGVQALPIVSLISILVGLILAFVGAIQLKAFGAQIYIADLVGISMLREMGAIMTGVIMAGRTGAAFAAQLGTMNVNEEIDALKTLGVSPMEFLVLPRILALMIMMPVLCLYADLMGILGGGIVGVGLFDISISQYVTQTTGGVVTSHLWVGLGKSVIFGLLVAVSGCMQGMQSGRSASAVGFAATSSVVMSIVAIIISDGIFAVLCNALGI
jgi:phospholipid/cholesterol/gamma-HCH transport system permease protein